MAQLLVFLPLIWETSFWRLQPGSVLAIAMHWRNETPDGRSLFLYSFSFILCIKRSSKTKAEYDREIREILFNLGKGIKS